MRSVRVGLLHRVGERDEQVAHLLVLAGLLVSVVRLVEDLPAVDADARGGHGLDQLAGERGGGVPLPAVEHLVFAEPGRPVAVVEQQLHVHAGVAQRLHRRERPADRLDVPRRLPVVERLLVVVHPEPPQRGVVHPQQAGTHLLQVGEVAGVVGGRALHWVEERDAPVLRRELALIGGPVDRQRGGLRGQALARTVGGQRGGAARPAGDPRLGRALGRVGGDCLHDHAVDFRVAAVGADGEQVVADGGFREGAQLRPLPRGRR